MNDIKKIGNIIQFPGVKKNPELELQEDLVYKNASKINDLMLSPNWDLVTIDEELLAIIAEFGEHLAITSLAAHRLNSLLATHILTRGKYYGTDE